MKDDLIFHLVTKEDWQGFKINSNYEPQSIEDHGYIHCCKGQQVEDIANRMFKDASDVMLLVINTSLLNPKLRYEEDEETGEEYPHIYGPLNTDAVIDKIALAAEDDGTFNISFSEN